MAAVSSSLSQSQISDFTVQMVTISLANTEIPFVITLCKSFEIRARGYSYLKLSTVAGEISLGNYVEIPPQNSWCPLVAVNFINKTLYISGTILNEVVEIIQYL